MTRQISQGILALIVLAVCWSSALADEGPPPPAGKSARSSAVLPFNCLAPGNMCMNNGTCNHGTKKCDCPTGYQGFNCEAPTTLETCAVTCKNGASCSGEICFCAEGYVGGACQHARVQLECTETGIVPQMAPYSYPFTGKIHVKGKSANSKCQLGVEFIPILYLKTLAFTDCDIANMYSPKFGMMRRFDVVYHHNENMTSAADFLMTFICLYHLNGTLEAVPASVTDIGTLSVMGSPSITEANVTARIKHDNQQGNTLVQPSAPGDSLKLTISLESGSAYSDAQIDSVSAGSTDLIKGGCIANGAEAIVQSISKNPGTKTTTVDFRAFGMPYDLKAHMDVKVKLCTSSCTAPDCTKPSPTVSGDAEQDLHLSYAMYNPYDCDACAPSPPPPTTAPCEDNKNFYFVPVVVLAILTVIVAIAAIIGCVLWNQAKKASY